MQQTGCLKKRRRRNLAKVTGLGVKPYDETSDTYRGLDLYQTKLEMESNYKMASERFSLTRKSGKLSSSTRITRDPGFSFPSIMQVEDNFEYYDEDDGGGSVYSATDIELGGYRSRVSSSIGSLMDATKKSAQVLARPYLLDQTVMARLKQLILLGKTSGAFPWSWNKKEHRIDKWGSLMEGLWKCSWAFFTLQTLCLTIFQFYSFYSRVKGETKTYREVFMNSLSVYWYICAVYFNVNMYLYKDLIRQYINTMFALNKELCDKFLVNIDGYKDGGRILINLSIPSNCSQVFASVALFCVMPYQPWYTYSMIYSPSNPWYWLIPGAVQEFVVVGQVITSYMLTSWIVVAHTNSVDFWLKEIQ